MRKTPLFLTGFVLFLTFLYLNNASWRAVESGGRPYLMAHRGLHQTYDRTGIDSETCTATRIYPPVHDYIENTIPSMKAAFAAGADMVELDIHPTTDGRFAVFHDWTLDCRTDGTGVTRENSLAHMKTLDIGYGYTADGGKSFPLRGKGIGLLPSLNEVLDAFPDKNFLINFKGRGHDIAEADRLVALLRARRDIDPGRLMVYGGRGGRTGRLLELMPEIRGFSRKSVTSCLWQYEAYGWTGILPEACKRTGLPIPINLAPYFWGWPNLFIARMKAADTQVFVIGPWSTGETHARGLDDQAALRDLPNDYSGGVWTDRIDLIAPEIKIRATKKAEFPK